MTRFLRDIGHPTSLTRLADHILLNLSEISGYPHGSLFLLDREHRHFRQIHTSGQIDPLVVPSAMDVGHPLVEALGLRQHIIDGLEPTLVPHSEQSDDLPNHVPGSPTLAIPLIMHGTLIAFAWLHSPPIVTGKQIGRAHV